MTGTGHGRTPQAPRQDKALTLGDAVLQQGPAVA